MNSFGLWFATGIEHITDINGYDHILFVTLLTIGFPLRQWKKLLILVTGFTIGHSVALALSVLNVLKVPQQITEPLIALSIFLTAVYHVVYYNKAETRRSYLLYTVVIFFGFIHGMGFSYLLSSMLGPSENPAYPLLCFNLGLEVGQLLIVAVVLATFLFLTKVFKFPFRHCKLIVSALIAVVALFITWSRVF